MIKLTDVVDVWCELPEAADGSKLYTFSEFVKAVHDSVEIDNNILELGGVTEE